MSVEVAFEELTRDQCLMLLRTRSIGRVGVNIAALPAVLPVNYSVHGDEIIFRTMPGTKLTAAALNAVVAFEVDDADDAAHTGWSVMVVGRAREIVDPDELDEVRRLAIDPWVGTATDHFVAIRTQRVSGRRISPSNGHTATTGT